MTGARLVALLCQVVGGVFLISAVALLVWWERTHNDMNHAGIFLLLGAILLGLVGSILLVMGIVGRPSQSGQSSV